MFRRIFFVLVIFSLFFGFRSLQAQSDGQEHNHNAAKQSTTKEAENVGNKICPVMGVEIDEETKATYEYEGKIYNFCCPACIDEFKKDPEKYIKKIEKEED